MKLIKTALSLVLFLLFIPANLTAQDVPFVPTSPEVVRGMLELAKVTEDDIVYDLGCGDGRIVVAAARDFQAQGVGVDSNPERIEESQENAKNNNVEDKVDFKVQNLFEADIHNATVVAIYLLNSVNYKLRPKLLQELQPGARIVSHAFDMEKWIPDAHQEIDNRDVYLWIVPENFSGIWTDNLDKKLQLDIQQEFQNVSGTLKISDKEYNISNATLNGKELTFTSTDKGVELKFKAELEEGQLTGIITSSDNTLNQKINAVREEGTMKALDPQIVMQEN